MSMSHKDMDQILINLEDFSQQRQITPDSIQTDAILESSSSSADEEEGQTVTTPALKLRTIHQLSGIKRQRQRRAQRRLEAGRTT